MKSAINHPDHYNAHPSGIECIDVVEHYGFNVGNAIKYLWRAGLKGDRIEDLEKAAWYIAREKEKIAKEAAAEKAAADRRSAIAQRGANTRARKAAAEKRAKARARSARRAR